MPEENERRHFVLKFNEGNKFEETATVEIWCDGREYDPTSEGYRPRYSYRIVTKNWEYVDNDIFGKINEPPNILSASRSLLAFLYACQEAKEGGENYDLFPPHVREWTEQYNDEIQKLYGELVDEMHNS